MPSTLRVSCLLAAAGLCAPAFAQDSTSSNGMSDALNPYATSSQCSNYVVDLAPVTSSQGAVFGVAPLIKSVQGDPAFFNNLISAQAISPDTLNGIAPGGTYALWEMEPGVGIHPTNNIAPGTVNAPASTTQFAAGFADFGANYEGVVAALVNFDPANPNRLYVARRQAAINGASSAQSLAQLGGLSLDAGGNTYFRSDTGSNTPTSLWRTRLADRACGVLNIINAATDATDNLLLNDATAHGTPNMLPASIMGGSGMIAAGSFDAEYVYGAGPGPLTVTTAHRPASVLNQRGAFGFSRYNLLNSAGAVASLGQLGQNAGEDTVLIHVWTVNGAGAPVGSFAFAPPASITDNETGVAVNAPLFELDHYHSQAAFRGGVGQVALTTDQAGRGLVAAARDFVATGNNIPLNDIIVGRFSTTSPGSVQWTLAAYINPTNTNGGKPVVDENGLAIGRLEELFDLTGGSPIGPSLSSPAFDSVGNVWFLGVVGFFGEPVPADQSASAAVLDFDTCLIRAVYDPADFSYSLEKVVGLGDTFAGPNSGVDYTITFMSIADSDSISSGSFFSGNASEATWNNTPRAGLATDDPRTNGGVVVNVEITYADEQEYNVLLYVGNYEDASCPCDTDGNGTLNVDDVEAFIAGFLGQGPTGDCDGNAQWNVDDVECFIACFLSGCN